MNRESESPTLRERLFKRASERLVAPDCKTENALDILTVLMQMVDKYNHLSKQEKKRLVIQLFEDVASGKDGILGTSDDLIPPYAVNGMRVMIESELLDKTIEVIYEATVGNVLQTYTFTNKITQCICHFLCCCCCISSRTQRPIQQQQDHDSTKDPLLTEAPSFNNGIAS